MEDIFCRIIKGEIPSTKIYEDDDVLAILDISQTTKGHTLVIPKLHCDNFLSCPQEVMHKVMDVAQRIGQAEISLLHARGVNILTNVNEAALGRLRRDAVLQVMLPQDGQNLAEPLALPLRVPVLVP